MLDLDKLLAPISQAQPCGADLAFSPELDAIARARQADDPSIEQGAWVTTLKDADWKFVAKQCAALIATRSKDLQLAVWLAEAQARTAGVRGLAESLLLLASLCERYWDSLYPMLDDGIEQRVGNLCWMAARIPQLVFDVAVTEDGSFPLYRVDAAGAAGADALAALELARKRSSRAFFESLLSDCELCEAAVHKLEQVVDARLHEDGPSFTAAKEALRTLSHVVAPMVREVSASMPVAAVETAARQASPVAATATVTDGPVHSRAQALAQLRAVAAFFRQTEPHSPVAYLADKAASWGEQPLHVWLRTVIKDDASFACFEELLGIEVGN